MSHFEISYVSLEEKHADETATLVAKCFIDGAPSRAHGVTFEEYHAFTKLYVPQRVEQDFSVVATAKGYEESHSVAGVITLADLRYYNDEGKTFEGKIDPENKWAPIEALLLEFLNHYFSLYHAHQLDHTLEEGAIVAEKILREATGTSKTERNWFDDEKLEKGIHASISFLAVDDRYQRLRIGSSMLQRGIELARKKGFKYLSALLTNPISQRMFKAAGFVVIMKCDCAKWLYESKPTYACVAHLVPQFQYAVIKL